jgi:tetratricopeptide (TPR) repeat protein
MAEVPLPVQKVEATSPVSVEQSPQLFAALCAAYAGGYPIEAAESQTSLRVAVLRELERHGAFSKSPGPALTALREFYRKHELADRGATLARYVSYGLVMGPPPRFDLALSHEDVPPDAVALEGFSEVLAAWYQEAHIAELYQRAEPAYEREARKLEHTLSRITLLETGYIREILQPSRDRTFTVYAEPLVGAQSNFRTYAGRYALVVDPQRESVADEIRHSMLHFLLDGMAMAHHPPLEGRKALLDAAARAPRLPIEYGQDIVALTDECLVKAVELRIQKLPPQRAQSMLDAAEADGFVLIRPMYTGLESYEKGEDSLSAYYETLLRKINLSAEAKRLAGVKFAPAAETQTRETPAGEDAAASQPAPRSELDQWLAEGEGLLAEKDTKSARAVFERILEKYPNVPRAQYGLAVCVVVDGEEDRGKALLEQVVTELSRSSRAPASRGATLAGDPGPALPESALADPQTLAWAHIWLGRIYDQRGLHDLAGVEYRAALAVESAPQSALSAAQRGLAEQKPRGGSRP